MERDLFSEKVGTSIELKGDFFFLPRGVLSVRFISQ